MVEVNEKPIEAAGDWPTVSIVIPCRNEAHFIGRCLDGLLNNGYPLSRLEILVVDGMSDDGTRDVVRRYATERKIVKLIDNPDKVTPVALNKGIAEAKGEMIMRMDAHTTCHPDYIKRCVEGLMRYGGDDVGGVWRMVPRDDTPMGRAITKALSARVGVGNVRYRLAEQEEPQEVDTVPFFFCRRELFDKVGLFNEKLVRIQDMEFKNRVARAGCRILLVPQAISTYHARSSLKSFWWHNWADGVWTAWAFADAQVMPVRLRHLVPAAFAATLIVTALLAIILHFPWPLVLVAGSYALVTLFLAARIAREERDLRYIALVPLVMTTMHLGRGLGSLWGVARLLFYRRVGHAVSLVLDAIRA